MNIVFKKIIIDNFLSFGHASLDLDNLSYTLVSGINERAEDNASSNGSGKSSIWEAIIWCLTGDTIRGAKSVSNSFIDDGPCTDIYFSIDNIDYRILRAKDNSVYKTTLKFWVNDEDKSGKGILDTKKIIQEYLPDLTASLLGAVIILGQGLPQRFTNNTPAQRKEILEKLSRSDFMIEDLKNRVSKRRETLNAQIKELNDKLVWDTSSLTSLSKAIDEAESRLSSMNESELVGRIRDIEKELSDISDKINEAEIERSHIQEQYDNCLYSYTSLTSKNSEMLRQCSDTYTNIILSKNNELNLLSVTLKSKTSELERIERTPDSCPTCGRKYDNFVKPDTSALIQEISDIKKKIEELHTSLDSVKKEKEEAERSIYQEVGSLIPSTQDELTKLKSNLSDISRRLDSLNNEKNLKQIEYEKAKFSLQSFNDTVQEIQSSIKKMKMESETINSSILYNKMEIENKNKQLGVQNKFETILKRDFRGYLLSSVIDFIDKRAKQYSQDIFGTDKMKFELDSNQIELSYDGKFYENLSGGEKQKVDLITQFSIRDMLCTFMNFSCNCLVLDEIFDNLDSIGCEKVIDVISNKLSDISSIFIITHHTDISIPYDNEIVVVKNRQGVSTIQ